MEEGTRLTLLNLIFILSTCEAEYVATNSAICHAIWLRNVLKHLGFEQEQPTMIHVDNQTAITMAKNPVFHKRSKHIDMRYHFIQEHVKNKEVELISCKSYESSCIYFHQVVNA